MKCRIYFEPLEIELKEATTNCANEMWKIDGFDGPVVLRVVMIDNDGLPVNNTFKQTIKN